MTTKKTTEDVFMLSWWTENSTGTRWQVVGRRSSHFGVPGKGMVKWPEMTERFTVDLVDSLGTPRAEKVRDLVANFTPEKDDPER
ncbi:hypothetical protein [Myxococcus stipitatus]|uniref:hypothetical protein n=1 Tax=Myxococcus stipitatus TaxID=83455 RepID=UPI0005C66550|nr:hypothetical protein [Myxococcus stipitatus]